VTSRFPLPQLEHRKHARLLSLDVLDGRSAIDLLQNLGVSGADPELLAACNVAGRHAKAVELLGTLLKRYYAGRAEAIDQFPDQVPAADTDEVEVRVAWVLHQFMRVLAPELCDLVSLATAFREPPSEEILQKYLLSDPARNLLHAHWHRTY